MGSAPSPPPAPNPVATAQAQTGENVDTAIANAELSHVNQTDPSGSTSTYSQTGTNPFTDPVSGTQYNIPSYSQTTALSPAAQQIFNTNQNTQGNIADTANVQSQQIGQSLDTPINLGGITQSGVNLQSLGNLQNVDLSGVNLQQLGALPNADLSANNINSFINTNWEQPLAYSQGNQQEQMNQSLADQGINLNDPAYNQAQINEGQNFQQQQDTYANAMYGTAATNILGATSLADQNLTTQNAVNNQNTLSQAGFNNQANLSQAGFNNSNLVTENQVNNQNALQQQGFNNNAAATQQGFNNQVMLTNQNQPINAITALMSGSQVQQPNFMQTPQTQIPTTDYANIVNQSYQDQLAAYNAQVQQQSSTMGGLFGLGGSVLGGLVGL
jgi:hypothetical protein